MNNKTKNIVTNIALLGGWSMQTLLLAALISNACDAASQSPLAGAVVTGVSLLELAGIVGKIATQAR
ncbi:hypothetical protein FACS18945_2310 [Bacteroidia bacterium]|nr:hypothetical protein FACS18945_2310 [Bacteroidia bacterium]